MACAPSHIETPIMGRPRIYDKKKIADELVEWSEKHDSINLNKFCALHNPKIPPKKISEWAKEDDYFKEAYEIAKAHLGFRREEWLNSEQMHVKAYDLNASTYDFFLKEEKIEQTRLSASVAADFENKKQNITINLTDYSKDKS